jgi:adenylate cyclase
VLLCVDLDQTEPQLPAAEPVVPGAGSTHQLPVDPPRPAVADSDNRALDRRMRRQLTRAIVAANAVGALLVFVFLSFVVSTPVDADPGKALLLNLLVFLGFMPIAMATGGFLSMRTGPPVSSWFVAGRQPDERERDFALRQPIRLASISAGIWAAAALLFGALNTPRSAVLGLQVAITVLLGGLATCVLIYLLVERIERPVIARALAATLPSRPQLPGVTTRIVLAWAFGTALAVLGSALVAGAFLLGDSASPERLASTVLFLSATALIAGLATAVIVARSVADPLDSVRGALAEVEAGNLAVHVPVYDGSEVGLLQAGFNRTIVGLRERDAIRDLFGRHVGEDVARQALGRGLELGGEVREVAVLFVDIVGSTKLAATHDPAEVVARLNRFFAIVVEVVATHGGWVNKFEGDAALCVFGVPLPQPGFAGSALAAGRQLDARLRAELPEVEAGIGLSAGSVVAGNIGAAKRFEYTVIGDAVNEAARLTDLSKTKDLRVLASDAIVSLADAAEAKHWRLREPVLLRGRNAPTMLATPL